MLSWRCFYCQNPINSDGQFVEASIEHGYKHGGSRVSERRFHVPCLERLKDEGTRPWNPETAYTVLDEELIVPVAE